MKGIKLVNWSAPKRIHVAKEEHKYLRGEKPAHRKSSYRKSKVCKKSKGEHSFVLVKSVGYKTWALWMKYKEYRCSYCNKKKIVWEK